MISDTEDEGANDLIEVGNVKIETEDEISVILCEHGSCEDRCLSCAQYKSAEEAKKLESQLARLKEFISQYYPGYVIKPVKGNGLCIINSFVEMLRDNSWEVNEDGVLTMMRSEILQNFAHYDKFSTNESNLLSVLDNYLKDPLKSYMMNAVDIFVHAISTALSSRTIIFQCDENGKPFKYEIAPEDGTEQVVLTLVKTSELHYDALVSQSYVQENGSEEDDTVIESDSFPDSESEDCIITSVKEGTRSIVSSVKIEDVKYKVEPEFIENSQNRYDGLDGYVCLEDQDKEKWIGGKLYIPEGYWEGIKPIEVKTLPYDINGSCRFMIPYNKQEGRFKASVDGRHWGQIKESKRSGFNGDRYLSVCQGYYECKNVECPFIVEFGRTNDVQFSRKGECKSCGELCQRKPCSARKFWEFKKNGIVEIRHYGEHSCTAIKKTTNENVNDMLKENPNVKPAALHKAVVANMIRSGANIDEIEEQSEKLLDRKRIVRQKAN